MHQIQLDNRPEDRFTLKQLDFYRAAIAGENIYLSGKAGTGKSYVVNEVIRELTEMGRNVVAVAPTGIAANNIGGQTIHSLWKLPPFGVLDYEACRWLKSYNRFLLGKIDTIVIDEVSMLRPDVLDGIQYTFKKNGLAGLEKRQIIFVGDLKQLPNIYDTNSRTILYDKGYKGETFLHAHILNLNNAEKRVSYRLIELDEIKRQSDPEFIEALNLIRNDEKAPYFRQFIHTEPRGIVLAPHNDTVARYNLEGLEQQEGEMFTFEAEVGGEIKIEDMPLEKTVKVKPGCKVMHLVNSQDNPLKNGTLGTFVERDGLFFIRVGEIDYALNKVEVSKKQYVHDRENDRLVLEEVGYIRQYPIKLAYALTIHKAQGLTFDEVTIDLRRRCFMPGQQYVAFSRARTPQGLRIIV